MSITSEQHGSFLVPVIMSKILNELQIIISRQLDKKSWYNSIPRFLQLKICSTYCQQNHTSASCFIVSDSVVRKKFLKKNGHCLICLGPNHVARDCKSTTKCAKCTNKHHSSICGADYSRVHHPVLPYEPTTSIANFSNKQ